MNLTDKQLELLHAHLDGETSDAEATEAQELLEDSGVQEYFDTCLKLRSLVKQHSQIPAPEALKSNILTKLPRNNVTQLDTFRWRGGLIAAAAAVAISVGVMFGLGGFGSTEAPDSRQDVSVAVQPSLNPADSNRPEKDTWSQPEDEKQLGSGSPDKGDKGIGQGGNTHSEPVLGSEPTSDGGQTPPVPTTPTDSEEVHDNDADPDDSTNSKRGTSRAYLKRAVLNLDRGKDEPMELSFHLNRMFTVSIDQAYNDLLMVSAMHGQAELIDNEVESFEDDDFEGHDFSSVEGILITIPASQLEEFLTAVNRMASDQKLGRVAVPEDISRSVKLMERSLDEEVALRMMISKRQAWGYAPSETRSQLNEANRKKFGEAFPGADDLPQRRKHKPVIKDGRNLKILLRLH